MPEAPEEPRNWTTIWDDSEEHIDNHPMKSIEFDEQRQVFKLKKGGHVKSMTAETLLKKYYD